MSSRRNFDAISGGAEAPLTSLLIKWHAEMEGTSPRLWQRSLYHVRRCKWVAPAFVVFMARSALDLALAHSLSGIQTPLQHVANTYSAMYGIFFFANRSGECSKALRRLILVATNLERTSDPATKAGLARAARWLRRTGHVHSVLQWLHLVVGSFTILVALPRHSTVSALLRGTGTWWGHALNALLSTVQMSVLLMAVIPYYRMQALNYVLFGSSAVLYGALGAACCRPEAGGEAALHDLAALHSPLLEAASGSRKVFEVPLLRLVLCAVVLPLFGTVELAVSVRRATASKFAVTIFRAVANLFIPTCFTGQLLEDNSGTLPLRLYEGPWPEENERARRLRLRLMVGAGAQARIELRGLGPLNARTCLDVLQKWFSFVNVLVNAQDDSAVQ